MNKEVKIPMEIEQMIINEFGLDFLSARKCRKILREFAVVSNSEERE